MQSSPAFASRSGTESLTFQFGDLAQDFLDQYGNRYQMALITQEDRERTRELTDRVRQISSTPVENPQRRISEALKMLGRIRDIKVSTERGRFDEEEIRLAYDLAYVLAWKLYYEGRNDEVKWVIAVKDFLLA